MIDYNKKNSAKAENEQRFYPDNHEIFWLCLVYTTVLTGCGLLLFMATHTKGAKEVLLLLFFTLLAYILYISYFLWKSPKLYIDKEHTYLRVKYSEKNEIIYLSDIKNYDYFYCYTDLSRYPFLCLCVQLFLKNGHKVEFFAFMKGAQGVVEDKMSVLGITKKLS